MRRHNDSRKNFETEILEKNNKSSVHSSIYKQQIDVKKKIEMKNAKVTKFNQKQNAKCFQYKAQKFIY